MKKERVWVSEIEIDRKVQGKGLSMVRQHVRNEILFHVKLLNSNIPSKSLIKLQEKMLKSIITN